MKELLLLFLLVVDLLAWDKCSFQSKKDDSLVMFFDDCLKIKDNRVVFNKKYLPNVVFNKFKFSCIFAKNKVFYLKNNGVLKESFLFDNGCDYFSQGLSRIKEENKISYIDYNLKVKIKTKYSYGSRFYKNKAIVCNNLKKKFNQDLKQYFYSSGVCNIINLKGKLLLQKELPYQKVLKLLELGKI